MVPAKSLVVLAVILVSLVVSAPSAAAEWFADLYGGAAFTQSHHFSLDGKLDGVAVAGLIEDARYDHSFTVGGRSGYWFESVRVFGLGVDVSHFRPDISAQTATGKGTITDSTGVLFGVPVNVSGSGPVKLREVHPFITALCFDFMLRWPMLASATFPNGQLQPYVTAGPGLYLQHLERFDTHATHGVQVGGGVLWELSRHLGVFTEYRYTHVRAALDSAGITLRTHLSTHSLLGGLPLRY
jgi:opacity protein-like surface antigen